MDKTHSIDFNQFRNDVLSRLGTQGNSNSVAINSARGAMLLSIFNEAAKNDGGTKDNLFEYDNENQYNELLQKGIEHLSPKQNKNENTFSLGQTVNSFWKGFSSTTQKFWNNLIN